jgi:hypothetical protein
MVTQPTMLLPATILYTTACTSFRTYLIHCLIDATFYTACSRLSNVQVVSSAVDCINVNDCLIRLWLCLWFKVTRSGILGGLILSTSRFTGTFPSSTRVSRFYLGVSGCLPSRVLTNGLWTMAMVMVFFNVHVLL